MTSLASLHWPQWPCRRREGYRPKHPPSSHLPKCYTPHPAEPQPAQPGTPLTSQPHSPVLVEAQMLIKGVALKVSETIPAHRRVRHS